LATSASRFALPIFATPNRCAPHSPTPGALVHLAAIAIEKSGESYEAINTDATATLMDAARSARIERIVHMSQNGASSKSPYRFLKSKGLAEDIVTSSSMKWTVIKPSVIFGPEDEFVNVLARMVRLSPFVFPLPGGGVARFQPIAVDDVARAIIKSLELSSAVHKTYSIGGPVPLTLRQMTERILVAMNARRKLISVPVNALRPLIAAADGRSRDLLLPPDCSICWRSITSYRRMISARLWRSIRYRLRRKSFFISGRSQSLLRLGHSLVGSR
jgi:NADH dehydrogenase